MVKKAVAKSPASSRPPFSATFKQAASVTSKPPSRPPASRPPSARINKAPAKHGGGGRGAASDAESQTSPRRNGSKIPPRPPPSSAAKVAAKRAEKLCASGRCADALVPLQRAIDLGDTKSRALMAWLLIDGREDVAKDRKRAFKLAKEGSRLGCHHCRGVLAYCYLNGFGCAKDEALSLELARESSGRGSRYGQFTLGRLHRFGAGGLARDDAQAVAFYRLAAAQGLDEAQYSLGDMYYLGEGVAHDYTEALQWYKLAAAQGHPGALYAVAECYERGRGVAAADVAEAIRWYRRAQAAGDPYAADKLRRLGA